MWQKQKGSNCVDTSNLATKSDLPSSNAEIDEIDMDTLKTVPADLSKLVNVVDKCNVVDVVKKMSMINSY